MTLDVEAARRAVKPSSCDPADAFDRRRQGATGGFGGIERAVGDFEQLAGPLAWFQAALKGVEAEIAQRNAGRMQPYPYLRPSLIPTSINI